MLRHTKEPRPPVSLRHRFPPHDCVCRERPIIELPPEPSSRKESENTLLLLLSNNKYSHHHPPLHVAKDLFSRPACL